MSDDRHEIAWLCENLPWLRTTADAAGLSAQLESVVSAAAAGRADGITKLLRRMDVPEVPTLRVPCNIIYLPTVEARHGVEAYGCPADICDRSWIRPPGVSVPICSVRGVLLKVAVATVTGLLVEVGRRLAERWLAVLVLPGLLLVGVLTIGVLLGQADALSANRLINVATESAHRLQAVGGVAVGMAVVAVLLIAGACGWPRRVEPTSPRGMARRLAAMVRAGAEPPDSQAS